jgi:phosphatidylinositol-3-phosphatase
LSTYGRRILALLVNLALLAGCAGNSPSPAATPPASGAASRPAASAAFTSGPARPGVPAFAHVYVIVLENKEYGSIIGGDQAPYLNSLVAKYGSATSFFGETHPSQPNYLAFFSGSTQGVTDDGSHDLTGTNLVDQLEAAGKTWLDYQQDYPGGCFAGSTKDGSGEGIGKAGSYARKHNPAISFTDISSNPTRCARIVSLAGFDPAAADFELIVPNQCNDMHSCPVSDGDGFLSAFVPRITGSAAFADSVLFITWDEGTTNDGGGGQIATLVISPLGRPGFTSATRYDHYSLLRTIEDSWGLSCMGQACSAANMAEFFK